MNFKQHKTHTSNFTIIPNNIFKDKTLSMKAKGLLCLMLSLPPTWEFSEVGLSKLSSDNITSIKSGLKELESAGYLRRERIRNEKGHLKSCIYHIFEEPMLENPTLDEKPTLENPTQENAPQLNTNQSKTKESININYKNLDESTYNFLNGGYLYEFSTEFTHFSPKIHKII